MKAKARYTYMIDGRVLFIEDMDDGVTVTNDIENVLEDITERGGTSMDNFDIIYRDSDRNIDGIKTRDGKFLDFYYIGESSYYAAKLKIKK